MDSIHLPVLPREVIDSLNPKPGQVIADGTLGGGGHARLIAEAVSPDGRVIAMDRDATAVQRMREDRSGLPIEAYDANYCRLPLLLERLEIDLIDGMIIDLGLSSDQLEDCSRGFSFTGKGPLDMRFDPDSGQPAWEWLANVEEKELADTIYKYGEERLSRRIARVIVEQREHQPVKTASQLAEIISRCVPRSKHHAIHPATRTFQALRIAINDELGSLEEGLRLIPDCIRPGGRLAIISFHSLEDRMVKHAFRDDQRLEVLTKKPIQPGEQELYQNRRSRSSKMRVAQRV